MRYDDASQTGSTGHSEPVARPDEDRLPPGSFGPATGNAITGAGTTSGASGADHVGAGPATITAVQGAGGQTVATNGAYQAAGEYGLLSMDMQGNFSYVRNPGTPDGVKDVFNYTLADATGANSSTTLTIDIGQIAAAAAGQGIVNLPQGVELSDIHVNGRDLVINMPDGTQMVIPGGAVFVPQLVIGDVQVPPTNLAALLVDNEPQPGAGQPLSSGGNFADPVPPLDPGVPLGDLIPPTELTYTPPEFRPIGQFENQKPTVIIEPHDLAPGAVDALDQVNEAGLPAPRDGNVANETPGSGEIADGIGNNNSDNSENTFGQIVFTSGDGLQSITVDGVAITSGSVGTTIQGQFGTMTITSVNLAAGTIGYTYSLTDNTSGDNTADHFTVIVTDTSGDVATATLTVDIIDDVPTAHNDTDAIVGNDQSTDGNVMTGAGTTSGAAGADVVGADNATVTGAHPGTSGGFTSVPQDGSGVVIHGSFGDLTLHDDGTYTYTRSDVHQGGTEVFTYQLTDGDGDTSTATLTITVPQVNQPPVVEGAETNVSEEGLVGGNPDSTGSPDTTNSATASGSIGASDPDNDALTIALQAPGGSFTSGGVAITWALSDNGHTLTGNAGENTIITITIDNGGHYDVTLSGPLDDPNPNAEDSVSITVPVSVSDGLATTPGTLVVTVEDDSPVVNPTVNADATVTLDETGPAVASTIDTGAIVKGDDPDVAGSGAISSATSGTAIVNAHAAFGGDGPAASDALTYALSITNASSGLTTTDGSAINLVMENGAIVGVVSGGAFDGQAAFAISINSSTGVVTVEQYLSLDHPDTTNPNDALHMLTGSVGVTVTATDADGDHTTSGAVDVSNQITFLDDGPTVSPTVHADATVTLDETGPAVASTINTGAIVKGDDPDVTGSGAISKATSGTAVVDAHAAFGADGPAVSGSLAYALSITNASSGLTTTDGHAINLVAQGGVIVGVVSGGAFDGEAAFAISIDPTTGVVTVEQYLSLDHPDASNPNDALHMLTGSVGVTVTATDGDGDHVTSGAVDISNQITFLDDGPTVSPTVHADATVTLDETGPAVASTISTGAIVKGDDPDVTGSGAISKATSGTAVVDAHAAFGADGPAVSGSLGYALSITNASSGLTTTDGHAINLVAQGGVIVGVVSGGAFDGEAAFAISIDPTTGVVTIEQYLSLDHPNASDPNDALHMLTGSVGVTVTATDGDGDHVTSGAVDISNQITFLDDGPTVNPTVHADATVVLDETGPAVASAISTGVVVKGDDPDVSGSGAIAKATSGVAVVDAHAAFGADGPATSNSLSYTLSITNASSGLTTTDGHAINLVAQGGVIVGVVSGGAFDGEAAFAISINSTTGVVTVEQYLSLNHPVTTDPNDALHMLTGSVGVTVTATDGDGDHVTSGAVDISNQITFLDDGPAAHPDTNTVNEGATVTGNVETNDLFGADGKDTGGGVTGVESGSHPTAVVTTGVGSPIAGTWGTLTLNADGSYSYHANANSNPPPGSTDVFTYTIKDGDGDTSTTTLTITVNDVTATVGSATTFVSEEVLPVVGTERNGDTDSDAAHDVLVNSGNITLTDSLGGATFTTALTAPSGTFTSGGTTIVWTPSNGGHTMTGSAGGNTVIVATIDNSGHYTVTLSGPIDTPNGVNAGENGGDSIVVFGVTATDNLGNTLTPGSLTVHVEDDAPTIDVTKGADSGVSLTTDDADTIGTNTDHASTTANFGGVFGLTFQTGADGTNTTPTLQYTLDVSSSGVDSGLDSHGSSIFLYVIGGVVVGSTATSVGAVTTGNTIFDVSVNSSGQVTLDQFSQIDHPILSDPTPTGTPFNDQSVSLADNLITLTASSSITDKDGDTATDHETVNIGANLHFTDDGPSAAIATTGQAISVDETPGIQADANDVAGPLAAFAGVTNAGVDPNMPAQFATNANAILTTTGTAFGADGPGTSVLSLNVSSAGVDSGLNTTDGHDILLFKEGDLIVGRVSGGTDDGKAAFAVSIDQTGHLSMVEYLSIQHGNTGSADESASINSGAILGVVTVTDFDGDTASQSVGIGSLISFQDDGPTLGTVQSQQTDNNPATAPAVGTLHFSSGADGAGSTMTITADNTGLKSGGHSLLTVQTGNVLTAYQDTNNDGIHQAGESTVVYTLTVNPSAGTSGQYVFDLVTPIDPTVTDTPIGGSSSFGAGPTGFQVLNDASNHALSVLSGYDTTASFNEATWLATGSLTSAMITDAGINGSTAGWGVDNNNFEGTNEFMFFDFGSQALSDPDGAGGIDPGSSGASLPNISTATFNFSHYSATDDITYVVHYTDGTFESGHIPSTSMAGADWVFTAQAGKFIADIQLNASGAGAGKVDLVSVGVQTSSLDVQPSFTVQLTDGDGDHTTTGAFNVHIATGLVPFAPAAPVVLDLNGDGVHFLGTEAGVTYNYGHGEVATAWVSPQDGILVNDANHDGQVTANEFVFGGNGATDLQGLAAFDTNHDGQLNSADASFANFAVWQDANSNGKVDAGELQSLTARGITSISLSSNGIGYSAANGDVQVAGTGTYTRADGSTGVLADAAFQTGSRNVSESLNSSTALATNAALIGAVAAAGLEALQGVHSDHMFGQGVDHASVSAPMHDMVVSSTPLDAHVDTAHVQLPTTASATAQSLPQHSGSAAHDMVVSSQPLTIANGQSNAAPTELLHGSEGAAHAQGAISSPLAAMAVVMPSAAQLAAAASHGVSQAANSVAGGTPQHDQVVTKVLVDALHGGGGGGPSIDGLLNNAGIHGASQDALQALASHGSAAVSFGHTAFADAFGGAHGMLLMHPDVAPPVHG